MEKKKFKLGLLPKLLIAIVLGIIIGQFFPVWSAGSSSRHPASSARS